MKKLLQFLSCAVVFGGLAAHADVFTFTFSTVTDNGSLVFSNTANLQNGSLAFHATPTGTPGEFLVTSLTGTTDGHNITALLPVNTYPSGLLTNDNDIFFPAAVTSGNVAPGFFDLNGLSYALDNGTDANLYYGSFGTGFPEVYNIIVGPNETNFLLTTPAATTPEPSSLMLLGTGALGLVGMIRRRFAA